MVNIQRVFAKHLIINRGMMACDEVSHYGHICDVLAVDYNKRLIYEYEFKASSADLKIAEFQKDKYKPYKCTYGNEIAKSNHYRYSVYRPWRVPHFFYFVMPEFLFKKEEKFIRSLSVGCMFYRENNSNQAHMSGYDFYLGKRMLENRSDKIQHYQIAVSSIANRYKNLYAFQFDKTT